MTVTVTSAVEADRSGSLGLDSVLLGDVGDLDGCRCALDEDRRDRQDGDLLGDGRRRRRRDRGGGCGRRGDDRGRGGLGDGRRGRRVFVALLVRVVVVLVGVATAGTRVRGGCEEHAEGCQNGDEQDE